ncbi:MULTISPECIES: C39 family peptidase [unclassified Crossiella]|uniref:C39 family peptidase n=1 Tax=unclassified Crossiella TaxID=2620835 RepID=UPI001FFF984F|nr:MULTISPECIES: C39 family peptidase [unclassified Crossiella]MCK2241394.1 C39 family peptidase [Crossiella sp. S99.2]MCK2253462.1 C39 family peptidase [Crossiella sp. S99.1]
MTRRLITMVLVSAVALLMGSAGLASATEAPAPEKAAAIAAHDLGVQAQSRVLNHTWQRQQTGYWCGPGSTWIALSTRVSPPSQQTLANYMGTHTGGTDHIGLVRNALNRFANTQWFAAKNMYDPPTQAQRDLLKRDVLLNLDNGYPMVANVVSGWRPPGYPGGTIYHYVAILGYGDYGNTVLIGDPAGEGAGGGGWSNVPRTYWISTHNLGTWIGGKGYAA